MKHRAPNTKCAHCGKPIFRLPSVQERNSISYCSKACYGAGRTNRKNDALAYVAESMATLTASEMAQHLQISRDALASRIAMWRQEGLLSGHNRPYTPKKKQKSCAKYFSWRDFENDIIVGGNLYPENWWLTGGD